MKKLAGNILYSRVGNEDNLGPSAHSDQDCLFPNVEVMPLPMAAESLIAESFEVFSLEVKSAIATTTKRAVTPRVARI